MNEAQMTVASSNNTLDSDEAGLLNLLITMAKHKRVLLGAPLIVAVLSAALSFALPSIYKATTKLLPPQQAQSSAAALLSQLGGMAGVAAGVAGLKNPNDLYIAMLKSRTVADKLIERFDLKKVYAVELQEEARKALESNSSITSGKDGLITIEVESKDKKLVAQLANGYVAELTALTKTLAVTEASQRRVFFEQQLALSKDNLAKAEMRLKGALDTRGVISVDAESRAMVEMAARLKAQISAKEIQINSMGAFVTAANPEYKMAMEQLGSLRAELSKLENGHAGGLAGGEDTQQREGLENIKVLRDVKYYQMLYELLAKQYEIARLDEAKDASIIQVLDPAIEPERRFKPKRSLVVLVSTLIAIILASFWAFMSETKKKILEAPSGTARLAELRKYLSGK
jgi:uncharacterized protein involved in exopolysaccharide biosynthesis